MWANPMSCQWQFQMRFNDLGAQLRKGFETAHKRVYGHLAENDPVEVVTLRLQAFLPAPELPLQAVGVTSGDSDSRPAYFGSDLGWHDVAVVSRSQLSVEPSAGPFIVEDYDATTLVPPGIWARLDEWGNVVIDLKS